MPSISTVGKNVLTVAMALAAIALAVRFVPQAAPLRDFLLK